MISVTKLMEAAEANVCQGGLQNDNEELRVIHQAMAVAFRMARDAVAAFITKNWVAALLRNNLWLNYLRQCYCVRNNTTSSTLNVTPGSLQRVGNECASVPINSSPLLTS